MKVVMVSINPLFADKVIGGSTKHLQRIACHLGELGHTVVVLCTMREDSRRPLRWHENVLVKPVFVFKQPFPLPYDVPAFQFAANIQHVVDELADADRLYMHDGEFLFPPLCRSVPSVVSLRDCVYPETMLGSFLFDADAMISLNDYCRRVLLATAGRFLADLADRVSVIPNGFDWDFFRPTPASAELLGICQVDPAHHDVILHPHRPETSKGLPQTIDVADRLVHRYGWTRLRVLVPKWFDAGQTPEMQRWLNDLCGQLRDRGLIDHFVFHDWLPLRLMPEYYSLARLTLVLGHFVEAFGNSTYESLGCGTPAIVSRVGSNRELVPDALLPKVDFNDADAAAQLADEILRRRSRTGPETFAYLKAHYGVEDQCRSYARVILEAHKKPPMRHRLVATGANTKFVLPTWCYRSTDSIYHDFRAEHRRDPVLIRCARDFPEGGTAAQLSSAGITAEALRQYQSEGWIIPG